MADHTPGKWHRNGTWVYAESSTPVSKTDDRKINVFTCKVMPQTCSPEEAEANARLIESAPELLEACQKLTAISQQLIRPFAERGAGDLGVQAGSDQWHAAWMDMKAAIAKATGE